MQLCLKSDASSTPVVTAVLALGPYYGGDTGNYDQCTFMAGPCELTRAEGPSGSAEEQWWCRWHW